MTISPAEKRRLDSGLSDNPAQQQPDRIAWKLITCCASGMTMEAIAAEGGDSPTQGAWRCRSKKIAPVRRTAFSTSERTSIVAHLSCRTIEQEMQTTQHTSTLPGHLQRRSIAPPKRQISMMGRIRGGGKAMGSAETAKSEPALPVGVNHIVLNVRDMEQSHEFWTEIVGLRLVGEFRQRPDRPRT